MLRPLCSGLAHLFHVTSASGYILWWSVDYVSICLAILATSIVSGWLGLGMATAHLALTLAPTPSPDPSPDPEQGRFAFYCLEPLQILFFTSVRALGFGFG